MGTSAKRYIGLSTITLLLLSLSFIGCKEKRAAVNKSSYAIPVANSNYIKSLIENTNVLFDSADIFDVSRTLRTTYANTAYQPLWLKEGIGGANVNSLLVDIDAMAEDGLNPTRYHSAEIRATLEKAQEGKLNEEQLAAFDTTCTYYYLLAAHDLLLGRLKVVDVDTEWLHRNDTLWLASSNLQDSLSVDVYPNLSLYKSKLTAYHRLKEERKKYTELQSAVALKEIKKGTEVRLTSKRSKPLLHPEMLKSEEYIRRLIAQYYDVQLPEVLDSVVAYHLSIKDSMVRKIDVNLERLRWLPQKFEDIYLIVNVPAMNLYLNIDNKDTMHMRVVIGKKSRATPTMSADMVNIVFNPTWTVPPGIMKKDIIPGINKKGAAYLEKKGLAIFTHGGKPLNLDSITVTKSNFKKYVFRQPPGYRNALGRVKFNLPNKHNIYLHDTPSRSDFRKKKRDKSSGCIRVQHPRDMAGYILTKINKEENSKRFVDSLINKNKMIFVQLERRIPVHILYLTATEDSAKQHVVYLDDVYNKDEAIALQLQ